MGRTCELPLGRKHFTLVFEELEQLRKNGQRFTAIKMGVLAATLGRLTRSPEAVVAAFVQYGRNTEELS